MHNQFEKPTHAFALQDHFSFSLMVEGRGLPDNARDTFILSSHHNSIVSRSGSPPYKNVFTVDLASCTDKFNGGYRIFDLFRNSVKLPGVTLAEHVTGPYDVVVRAAGDSLDSLVGSTVTLRGWVFNWRKKGKLRFIILRDGTILEPEIVNPSGWSLYDRAANLLHEYYTIQARLTGVLPAQYMTTDTPSAVLELAINQVATELSGRVRRPADREYLAALPQHLAAAKYVGTNDVQRTLLLERIWLRLLAAEVVLEHADRADDADQLVAQLGASDTSSKHILTQLRDGHETILRMWLLRCEP